MKSVAPVVYKTPAFPELLLEVSRKSKYVSNAVMKKRLCLGVQDIIFFPYHPWKSTNFQMGDFWVQSLKVQFGSSTGHVLRWPSG